MNIDLFENPAPERDYVIQHINEEFTSVCPVTGHPDFGTITLTYVADALCIELKSLKMYYQDFRNRGIYYEAVTNQILDDLVAAAQPRWMKITTDWKGRGGIRSTITAKYRNPGLARKSRYHSPSQS